jgi:hypothetical protein
MRRIENVGSKDSEKVEGFYADLRTVTEWSYLKSPIRTKEGCDVLSESDLKLVDVIATIFYPFDII